MTDMSAFLKARWAASHRLAGAGGVAAAAALVAVMYMGSTLLTPLYALYRQSYGFSVVTLTLLYSVYVIGNLTALLFLGRVSDQIGRRPVALVAMGLAAASMLGFLAATSPPWLFAARIVSGLSVGLAAGAGTAWIAELIGGKDRAEAARLATLANFLGLAAGPLLGGLLAQYAPWPQRLPFPAYLVVLAGVAAAVALAPETVKRSSRPLGLRPRLGVPAEIRLRFIPPAVSLFGTMALVGFYAALIPTLLGEVLQQTNVAIDAAVAALMFLAAAAAIVATSKAAPRPAMLWGLALMIPSVGLLVWARADRSMAWLLAGAIMSGCAAALGYRGSLQVVNTLAPADRRAEVVSTYFLAGFAGNALPVIGVGLVSAAAGSLAASAAFAGLIALFALIALALELRRGSAEQPRSRSA
jgi:MFS family permease